MNPMVLIFAVGCSYLAGNEKARGIVFRQLGALTGRAIDSLNRRGYENTQPTKETNEQPVESQE